MSKGSKPRPVGRSYGANYDKIFRKKPSTLGGMNKNLYKKANNNVEGTRNDSV